MYHISGGFYNGVIGQCKENSATRATSYSAGMQTDNPAYTVGRKDVRNKISTIKRGINDELSVDFSYGNTATTLSMTLDEGEYDGASLVKQIQEKLSEQLLNAGFSEDLILAGIGNIPSTGVYGANDNNALNFKLNTSAVLPGSSAKTNEYVIDGVSGSAAFTVFYQTDGDIDNAYVTGNKDVSGGVTIESDENELCFSVDGTEYTITLEAGDYTSEELTEEVNDKLIAAQVPLTAGIADGCLRLTHRKYGTHTITDIGGSAKSNLFFEEHGSTEAEEPIHIQLSSGAGDVITIERPRMTTSFLKINSTAITQPKYANKALSRLAAAVDTVSAARTMFGTAQNRLEHALAGNGNTAENTSSAESRLRDADMAETMMEYARNSILEQAAQAMQAQANTMPEGLLRLLG